MVNRKLSFSVLNTYKDEDCNIIILDMEFGKERLVVGSLYGPNQNEEKFFQNLDSYLKNLKQNYEQNSREIHTTERILNGVISTELRAEIVQNKKFEVLNDEKLTSHFVSLTKIKGQDATISDICDDQESMFANSSVRSNYIKKFFGDLYKKPNDTVLSENCISEFLGEVSTHETVVNAKLNDEEKLT